MRELQPEVIQPESIRGTKVSERNSVVHGVQLTWMKDLLDEIDQFYGTPVETEARRFGESQGPIVDSKEFDHNSGVYTTTYKGVYESTTYQEEQNA